MVVALAGRAAEEVVFGRVTNGAANDLEKVTEIARAMVFEWGMSDMVSSRTMRADNYALSEETKRAPRQRAGTAHRHGVHGGPAAPAEAPRPARPPRSCAPREGDARARGGRRAARRRRAGVARVRLGRRAARRRVAAADGLAAGLQLRQVDRVLRRGDRDRRTPRRSKCTAPLVAAVRARDLDRIRLAGGGDVERAAAARVVDEADRPSGRRRSSRALREVAVGAEHAGEERPDVGELSDGGELAGRRRGGEPLAVQERCAPASRRPSCRRHAIRGRTPSCRRG